MLELFCAFSLCMAANVVPDCSVNVGDVQSIVGCVLDETGCTADVNCDGATNVADAIAAINIIPTCKPETTCKHSWSWSSGAEPAEDVPIGNGFSVQMRAVEPGIAEACFGFGVPVSCHELDLFSAEPLHVQAFGFGAWFRVDSAHCAGSACTAEVTGLADESLIYWETP